MSTFPMGIPSFQVFVLRSILGFQASKLKFSIVELPLSFPWVIHQKMVLDWSKIGLRRRTGKAKQVQAKILRFRNSQRASPNIMLRAAPWSCVRLVYIRGDSPFQSSTSFLCLLLSFLTKSSRFPQSPSFLRPRLLLAAVPILWWHSTSLTSVPNGWGIGGIFVRGRIVPKSRVFSTSSPLSCVFGWTEACARPLPLSGTRPTVAFPSKRWI